MKSVISTPSSSFTRQGGSTNPEASEATCPYLKAGRPAAEPPRVGGTQPPDDTAACLWRIPLWRSRDRSPSSRTRASLRSLPLVSVRPRCPRRSKKSCTAPRRRSERSSLSLPSLPWCRFKVSAREFDLKTLGTRVAKGRNSSTLGPLLSCSHCCKQSQPRWFYTEARRRMTSLGESHGPEREHRSHWRRIFVCVGASQSASEGDAWTPRGSGSAAHAQQMCAQEVGEWTEM